MTLEPTFIEMFSGVGGMREGLRRSGWICVWANDNDRSACKIYHHRFGYKELVEADIKTVNTNSIPDHTLLTAGFPCQAFSVAGKRKGFRDTRGTLFYEICRVAEAKRPPLLLLENVKGLLSHDEGLTFQIILESLEELGYLCEWQVLNSKHFGVPQNRERVFIIGHLGKEGGKQIFPIGESNQRITQISREMGKQEVSAALRASDYKDGTTFLVSNVYGGFNEGIRKFEDYSPTLRTPKGGGHLPMVALGVRNRTEKHCDTCICDETDEVFNPNPEETDNHCETCTCNKPKIVADRTRTYAGKGRNLESPKPISGAISSVQKDNLVMHTLQPRSGNPKQGGTGPLSRDDGITYCLDVPNSQALQKGMRIRRLTPVECERLQGFPDGWTKGVSDTQRYKLLGNAVTVNVIEFLGHKLLERLF